MGPPPPPHTPSSRQHTRLALLSLTLTLLTLTGTTLLSLTLLPAAFSPNSTPLLPFLAPPRSIVLLLQQVNLLTPDDGLSSRIAVPTSIQAGWALVAAVGSLIGVVGSGALLLARRGKGDRYARAGLALFCVCLGAAWGGGLVTGTTQILLLWVPHDHLMASCKAAFLASSVPSNPAPQASQCSRRLYALLGIYVGVLLAWGVVAGALLEAQRRICRGLSWEVEMVGGERGRDVEAKVEVARERPAPLSEVKASFPAARPQVTFAVDPWHGYGHGQQQGQQQDHPVMASPQRHPTILRPASARSTPTSSAFSSPALSSSSSLSSARTLVWSSSPAAATQKYSPYSSTTPSRSSLLSKSPIVY